MGKKHEPSSKLQKILFHVTTLPPICQILNLANFHISVFKTANDQKSSRTNGKHFAQKCVQIQYRNGVPGLRGEAGEFQGRVLETQEMASTEFLNYLCL